MHATAAYRLRVMNTLHDLSATWLDITGLIFFVIAWVAYVYLRLAGATGRY